MATIAQYPPQTPVSPKSQDIAHAAIAKATKNDWIKANKGSVSPQEIFAAAMPWLVGLIVLCGLIISAVGTVGMVRHFVPNDLALASLGFEGGMVALAFNIFTTIRGGGQVPKSWYLLEGLLFLLILAGNLTGSINAVVEATSKSPDDKERFVEILYLIGAVIFSFIVPVINLVGGQMIAHIAIQFRRDGTGIDRRWRQVAYSQLYESFYAAYVSAGQTPGTARVNAIRLAHGYTAGFAEETGQQNPVQLLLSDRTTSDEKPIKKAKVKKLAPGEAMARLEAHIKDNPSDANLSVRQLQKAAGVGRDAAHRWKVENSKAIGTTNTDSDSVARSR